VSAMDENQKPFACTIEGCEMTFTNEDHLNWHHKKHDMVLNLGLAKNVEVGGYLILIKYLHNCDLLQLIKPLPPRDL
jgi:hypothetical protein